MFTRCVNVFSLFVNNISISIEAVSHAAFIGWSWVAFDVISYVQALHCSKGPALVAFDVLNVVGSDISCISCYCGISFGCLY